MCIAYSFKLILSIHIGESLGSFSPIHMNICIYMYIYICIYVYMYIYIYIHMYVIICIHVHTYTCVYFNHFLGENGPLWSLEVFHSFRLPFVGSAACRAPERCVLGAAGAPWDAAHGAERGRRQGRWSQHLSSGCEIPLLVDDYSSLNGILTMKIWGYEWM